MVWIRAAARASATAGIPLDGETTASTTSRSSFDRRMGAPGPVFLVSPAVAAASAITGRLTDPRRLPGADAAS
ncbi:MAG: hypothetical protein R3B09_32845 [Nannocystaceae bacterium]